MKLKSLPNIMWVFFLFLGLVACGESTPTPTTVPPTVEQITAVSPTATSEPATSEPTTTVAATAVPTNEPTAAPTLEPTLEATIEATAVSSETINYTITVDSPQPDQVVPVAQEFTYSGSVDPIPSQQLQLVVNVLGNESPNAGLITAVDVDPQTGGWSISEAIHPGRTGPAELHIGVDGSEERVTVPIILHHAENETTTLVTVNQPQDRELVVAGKTLLLSGESSNLVDGKIQVGLFGCEEDDDNGWANEANLLARIEIEAGNGPWRAQIIPPQTAVTDCDTVWLRVTTGGLLESHPQVAWASDQFLTLVAPEDERAVIFTVWDPTQLSFSPAKTTLIMGTAVNAVAGQIQVQLLQDDVVVASETAVPDLFGYWESELTLPADAETGDATLHIFTGADDTYHELHLPSQINP